MSFALALMTFSSLAHAAPVGDAFTRALGKGPLYAALAAFLGGLAVSLTPCVYPMVAVTVSVFGAQQTKSRGRGAALSASFVAGIVALLVPLGVIAGKTGAAFGSHLQNRWVVVAVSAVFVAMALSMFGAFELSLPSGLNNRLVRVGGTGYAGAFGLGLVCALIATPCTGPVLTGILAWIAQVQDAFLGAAAMAAFAVGLGAPFFLVGAFAVQLPKSGRWMMHVKSVFGIVLLVVALYFLATTFPSLSRVASPRPLFLAGFGGVVLVGLLLGAVHRDFAEPGFGPKVKKGLAVLLTTAGLFLFVTGAVRPSQTLAWAPLSLAEARKKAAAESRPMLVDFTAEWCGACKQLDRVTFSDPAVMNEARRFVAVQVDATDDEDPEVVRAMKELAVIGLPTVVLIDSEGREAVRYTDFVNARELLPALVKVR
ncbi:MAG: thioredoxin family protein [Polyangiaceae bacterium]|nr:thioredoxin family protein [Polyangiaceae bacterium]